MRKSDGSWLKPPPPYPCIQVRHLWNHPSIQLSFHPFIHRFIQGEKDKEENEHNLEDFISMEPGEGRFGEVWDQPPSFANNIWRIFPANGNPQFLTLSWLKINTLSQKEKKCS